MEKLNTYALSYPKVILQSGFSIGTPSESCLLLVYLDCSTQNNMFTALKMMMRDFTNIIRNGKYIVLVDDVCLSKGNIAISISLGSFFATYNVVYWAVTGIRRAEELQYTLFFASSVYFMTSPLTHGPVFEWNRGLLRNTTFAIYGQAVRAFPYTHRKGGGHLRGIDISIFDNVMKRIGCFLEVHIIEQTADNERDIENIMNRLHQMKLDVMVTRRYVAVGTLPVAYIADYTYYCLVAPRSSQVDLTRSLLRPFSSDVWRFIIACAVLINIYKEVSKYCTPLGVHSLRQLYFNNSVRSFYRIGFAVMCFVLIEAYLAMVTSFFLTYRFLPDARTLDEFFATGIPIRLEEGSRQFLAILEPRIRDLMRLYNRQYDQYLLPNKYVHVGSESSLEFGHLMSVWISVSIGWGVAFGVFALELLHNWLLMKFRKGKQFRKVFENMRKLA